jgi:hypothetical protein
MASHPIPVRPRLCKDPKADAAFDGPVFATEDTALIPDGEYLAQCVDYKVVKLKVWKRAGLRLEFRLLIGQEPSGVTLNCYVNYPEKIGRASRYFLFWCIANGGAPSRKAKMSPCVFKNHIFKVRTRTVTKNNMQQVLPACALYSVVHEILELQA